MPSAMKGRFGGIHGVVVTPFSADGSRVDPDRLIALVDGMVSGGIPHVIPCGNTGEFFSLQVAERRQVALVTADAARGRADVIVGVGGSLSEAVADAEHAAHVGAAAVMVHHPPHPFMSPEGVLAYITEVASVGLPVLPYLRQPVLDDDGIRRLADVHGVAGVKFAYNDLPSFAAAVEATSEHDLAWICGTAERWFPFFWVAGADGFTSGLVNVTTGPSRELQAALEAADRTRAMTVWERIRPFEELRARTADAWNVAVIKEALVQLGRPVGPVRSPATGVSLEMRAEIASILPRLLGAD